MKTGLKYTMLFLSMLCMITACEKKQEQSEKESQKEEPVVKTEPAPVPEKKTEVIVKEIVIEKPYIPPAPEPKTEIIRAYGYVRGSSAWTIKNKYSGYVTKVNFYSQQPIKKGDVILEYDNKTWRDSMEAKQNEI